MSECHRQRVSWRHNDSLQNKKVRKFVAFLTGVLGCLKGEQQKKHAGWQNLSNKFWNKRSAKFKAAALNAIYKANQSSNWPFKLEIVLKLAHLLGPLEQTQLHTESPNFGPRVVNTRPWRHYPNMGSYLQPNMVKNANFRGLRRIWEFLPTLCGVVILPPSQPRFLVPRWQWKSSSPGIYVMKTDNLWPYYGLTWSTYLC